MFNKGSLDNEQRKNNDAGNAMTFEELLFITSYKEMAPFSSNF